MAAKNLSDCDEAILFIDILFLCSISGAFSIKMSKIMAHHLSW